MPDGNVLHVSMRRVSGWAKSVNNGSPLPTAAGSTHKLHLHYHDERENLGRTQTAAGTMLQ